MANFILVQLLIFWVQLAQARVDRIHAEAYLGEKRLDSYSERYEPYIFQDIYRGKLTFEDDQFFQNYFGSYIFSSEKDLSYFLKDELSGGLNCPNETLAQHFDDLRYAYRLVTLSYMLEGQWHLNLVSDHLKLKDGCSFNLKNWASSCKPKTDEMKKFISRLNKFNPAYNETLPANYTKADWWKDLKAQRPKLFSHYRVNSLCKENCAEKDLSRHLKNACDENQKLMNLICAEEDEAYGLSTQRDAYYLLSLSNIINTFNKRGEAAGCLRRFSEVMAHKEVKYSALRDLFPVLQSHLRDKYSERFLQGRVFFFGSGKEFEDKGLVDIFVKNQEFKIDALPKGPGETEPVKLPEVSLAPVKKTEPLKLAEAPLEKKKIPEVKLIPKSAFLQAAEIRSAQNLEQVEVDMGKLRYDYVFTLNMINSLSERLSNFMTREALTEMQTYDKLGTKEGAVPLLFLKFMIDYQEHQGLWNILLVLGDKFYVSNEIDGSYKPGMELAQLKNDESTGRQWQLYILKP